jgi:hypothetical protein
MKKPAFAFCGFRATVGDETPRAGRALRRLGGRQP